MKNNSHTDWGGEGWQCGGGGGGGGGGDWREEREQMLRINKGH